MTLVQKFTEKYGKNPITLVEEANLKNFGLAKTWGLEKLLKEYVDTDDIKLVNDEFIKELVECFAEAKEKFPEGIKAPELVGANFEIPNQKASIPKSKGTLENFKDIVGKDELRPVMSGVYVAEDGFLVGTDAHKLIKLRTNEYSADKGKIIDLTKFIKSNGKILDFIDGKYPNYEQVIPKDNLKEGGLTTYAFYNLAKSAQEVKRLISNEIFNINIKLKTEEGETEVFAFSYLIMLEALTFAMANGWDFFTLEYSKPTRAVVLNFGDENIALVMPVMTRDRVLGAKTMTPEEIEENYRLGLTNQKSSKPAKAPKKPVTPSAPVSSEPFKKYTGELKDTSYIHRSNIESITLTNGEVLGKNDIIDGFYRVNKKMEDGGTVDDYVYAGKTKSLGLGQFGAMKSVYKKGDNYYTKDGENYKFFSSSDDLHNKIFFKMEHGGNTGRVKVGVFSEADLRSGADKKAIEKAQQETGLTYIDNKVIKKGGKMFMEVYLVPTEEYLNSSKFEHGGSLYADGGGVTKSDIQILGVPESEITEREWASILRMASYNNRYGVFILKDENYKDVVPKVEYTWVYNPKREDPKKIIIEEARKELNKAKKSRISSWIDQASKQYDEAFEKYGHGGSMYADGGNMFETPIAKYKEVSGKVVGSVPVSEEVYSSQVKDFVNYVYEVYEEYGFTKKQVKEAVDKYIKELGYQFTWGGGDSLDRERVYEYLKNPNLQGIKNPSFANGGKIDPIDMAEIEKSAIFYTEKGKWSPEPTIEKFEKEISEYEQTKRSLENNEIRPSQVIGTGYKSQYARPLAFRWLEERILIAKRAIEILKERMGDSMSSKHEVGDTVTFNSVLGGTKTGTIISKMGDEGFRVRIGDGFATIKKSAIV